MSAAPNVPTPDLPTGDLFLEPPRHGHFVQLYDRDALPLMRNVARYLSEGFARGEGAIAIVTPAHREILLTELDALGVDTGLAVRESRLLLLDAAETLSEFMVGEQPDPERLEKTVQSAVRSVQKSKPNGLRAYGEMVGLLWAAQNKTAAACLEKYWNGFLEVGGFSLYCSYPIDIFGKDFRISEMDALLCNHTHLIPTGAGSALESALHRAMDELLGSGAPGMKSLMKANYRPAWAALPAAEAIILWLRNNLPQQADEILSLARAYYNQTRAIPAAAN